MTGLTDLTYENYKNGFQSEFKGIGNSIYGSGSKSKFLPPLDLLILMLTNQISDLNNASTIFMGQKAQTGGTYTGYLDGVISGIKDATAGIGDVADKTVTKEPSAKIYFKSPSDPSSGAQSFDTYKSNETAFNKACTNFKKYLEGNNNPPGVTLGDTYCGDGKFCGTHITIGDYKLPSIRVYQHLIVHGHKYENPYYPQKGTTISLMQYSMYCSFFVQTYNGTIPVGTDYTEGDDPWGLSALEGSHANVYNDTNLNTFNLQKTPGGNMLNPRLASCGADEVMKVNNVLDAFSSVNVAYSMNYTQDDSSSTAADTTYTKSVTRQSLNLTGAFTGGGGELASGRPPISKDDGAKDPNWYNSGIKNSKGGVTSVYGALAIGQSMDAGMDGTACSDITTKLNASLQAQTTENSALTASRETIQKTSESFNSASKTIISGLSQLGGDIVRNQK